MFEDQIVWFRNFWCLFRPFSVSISLNGALKLRMQPNSYQKNLTDVFLSANPNWLTARCSFLNSVYFTSNTIAPLGSSSGSMFGWTLAFWIYPESALYLSTILISISQKQLEIKILRQMLVFELNGTCLNNVPWKNKNNVWIYWLRLFCI